MQKGEINISEIIKEGYLDGQVLQMPTRKENQQCIIKYSLMVCIILSIDSNRNVCSRGNFQNRSS